MNYLYVLIVKYHDCSGVKCVSCFDNPQQFTAAVRTLYTVSDDDLLMYRASLTGDPAIELLSLKEVEAPHTKGDQ